MPPRVALRPTPNPLRTRPSPGRVLHDKETPSADALARAQHFQRGTAAPLGENITRNGTLKARELTSGSAVLSDLASVDLVKYPPDPALAKGLNPRHMLRAGYLPWRRISGRMSFAVADADIEPPVEPGQPAPLRVLSDRRQIEDMIARNHSAELAYSARLRCPAYYSCRGTNPLKLALACLLPLLAYGAWAAPALTLTALLSWILLMTGLTTVLRATALFCRVRTPPVPSGPVARERPVISVLVPLLREDVVLRHLIVALERTTYPKHLLDVVLIIEPDDVTTPLALSQMDLPPWIRVLTTPPDTLKTKPRALNYALDFCRGEIVGIYDAEDRPDPDQLDRIAARFAVAGPKLACIQGVLDFYNSRQNWLSRCFAIEYAIWFRVLLGGVQCLRLPIPLGGTTVFLRRDVLERVGAWDAHNVTEDADLGMRLARFGYRTELVPTTTMEEANCLPRAWIAQRARWLKGYGMTWAAHMRHPARLLHDLGPTGFLGFQILFLGALTAYLALPLFWALWLGAALLPGQSTASLLPPGWWQAFLAAMLIGQVVMLAVAARAVSAQPRRFLLWTVPSLALYWPLGAIAAYRAMVEMVLRPFHWTKTRHGL